VAIVFDTEVIRPRTLLRGGVALRIRISIQADLTYNATTENRIHKLAGAKTNLAFMGVRHMPIERLLLNWPCKLADKVIVSVVYLFLRQTVFNSPFVPTDWTFKHYP
jgi:hypothetical protein